MTDQLDQADEDVLAGVDLHAWRVPAPAELDRPSLLVRALAPAVAPARRLRLGWLLAAMVLVNAAIISLIVILPARGPASEPSAVVEPAGGGSVEAEVRELRAALDRLERDLPKTGDLEPIPRDVGDGDYQSAVARLKELRQQRAELEAKLRQCKQHQGDCAPGATPSAARSCDEVTCVLANYAGACCTKFRSPPAKSSAQPGLPDGLDRVAISNAIAAIKPQVEACAEGSPAKGTVKAHVRVEPDGSVSHVTVLVTPGVELGDCVAAAVQRAVFPQTQHGGSFSYPFVF